MKKRDRLTIEEQRARIERETPPEVPEFVGPNLSEVLAEGRRRAARAGHKGSGPAPYGYRWERDRWHTPARLVVVPEETAVVQRIFRLYLAKFMSVERVCRALNAAGLRPRHARAWSRAGVAWILKNRTYSGYVVFGAIRCRGRHQGVVAPILLNKAGAKLRRQDKRPRGARS